MCGESSKICAGEQKTMKNTMSEQEIFDFLKEALVDFFEIDASKITMESHLYEDLEIDSIDAIDLMDHIKKKMGYRLEPADFKEVRTLGDIVRIVHGKMEQNPDLQNAK